MFAVVGEGMTPSTTKSGFGFHAVIAPVVALTAPVKLRAAPPRCEKLPET